MTHRNKYTKNLYSLVGDVNSEGFILCMNYYGDPEVVYYESLESLEEVQDNE